MIRIDAAASAHQLLAQLRARHDVGITTTYIWARTPEPLTAVDTIAQVVDEAQSW